MSVDKLHNVRAMGHFCVGYSFQTQQLFLAVLSIVAQRSANSLKNMTSIIRYTCIHEHN